MAESAAETGAERGRRGSWEWWRSREVERAEVNASRRKPQKRRLRGAVAGAGKEWRGLETAAAEEEVVENERERVECILKREREREKMEMVENGDGRDLRKKI